MKNIYIRLLQFLVGTEIDGDWGPLSCAAADELISQLRRVAVQVFDITREEVPEIVDPTQTVSHEQASKQ